MTSWHLRHWGSGAGRVWRNSTVNPRRETPEHRPRLRVVGVDGLRGGAGRALWAMRLNRAQNHHAGTVRLLEGCDGHHDLSHSGATRMAESVSKAKVDLSRRAHQQSGIWLGGGGCEPLVYQGCGCGGERVRVRPPHAEINLGGCLSSAVRGHGCGGYAAGEDKDGKKPVTHWNLQSQGGHRDYNAPAGAARERSHETRRIPAAAH